MSEVATRIAQGTSHGKLILVGEHSVVYGKPAIALPFPLEVRVTIQASHGGIQVVSDLYQGDLKEVPKALEGLAASVKSLLSALGEEKARIRLSIDSDIPIGRGMGSSAAVAIAVLRAIGHYYGHHLTEEKLLEGVAIAEAYAHGNASGIDMTTAAGHQPIWFERDNGMAAIDLKRSLYIAVGDTGHVGDTRMAVNQVRQRYNRSQPQIKRILNTMGDIAGHTKEALTTGNLKLLGEMMDLNHGALRDLGVSHGSIEDLVHIAKSHGALGAKLTGGGLGGCVLALGDTMASAEKIAKGFVAGGASRSWFYSSHHKTLTKIEGPVIQ